MFLSKTLRIFLISIVVIVFFLMYSPTSSALRIDHLEQHAGGNIITCENTTIFGRSSSSCNEYISTKKSESVTLTQPKEGSNQSSDQNLIPLNKADTENVIKVDKVSSLPLGIVSLLAVIGGVTPIYFLTKRLFQAKEIKALKERINVLETIVTKE
jgi:hypothetical protein